jgi:hypothetical protein
MKKERNLPLHFVFVQARGKENPLLLVPAVTPELFLPSFSLKK